MSVKKNLTLSPRSIYINEFFGRINYLVRWDEWDIFKVDFVGRYNYLILVYSLQLRIDYGDGRVIRGSSTKMACSIVLCGDMVYLKKKECEKNKKYVFYIVHL